jgi:hypothetical protein
MNANIIFLEPLERQQDLAANCEGEKQLSVYYQKMLSHTIRER